MKEKSSNFTHGLLSLIISQVFIKVFGVLYSLYLTNKKGFGDEGNAIYMSGYQIYALLLTFSSIGVPNAISKLISEKNSIKDYTNKYIILRVAITIFGTLGVFGCVFLFFLSGIIANNLLEIPKAKFSIMVLSPAVFFVSLSSVFRGYCNGEGKIQITAKSQVIEQILKSIFTIIFVEISSKLFKTNTEIMAGFANLATTVATFFSLIYIFIKILCFEKNINNFIFPRERITFIICKVLKSAIPITLCSILGVLGKNIDSMTVVKILKRAVGEKEAMLKYGILSSKVDILIALPLSFNNSLSTALIPEISRMRARNDIDSIVKRIEFSIIISLLICIPYCFGTFFYSNEIFEFLFPKASAGAELLKLSVFTLIFSATTQTINGALQGIGKNNIPLYGAIIGVTLKLIFNILLVPIPIFYEKGAIISNIISNICTFIFVFFSLKKNIKLKIFNFLIIKSVIISIFMIIISKILYGYLKKIILFRKILIVIIVFFSVIFYVFLIFLQKNIKKAKTQNRWEISNTTIKKSAFLEK